MYVTHTHILKFQQRIQTKTTPIGQSTLGTNRIPNAIPRPCHSLLHKTKLANHKQKKIKQLKNPPAKSRCLTPQQRHITTSCTFKAVIHIFQSQIPLIQVCRACTIFHPVNAIRRNNLFTPTFLFKITVY